MNSLHPKYAQFIFSSSHTAFSFWLDSITVSKGIYGNISIDEITLPLTAVFWTVLLFWMMDTVVSQMDWKKLNRQYVAETSCFHSWNYQVYALTYLPFFFFHLRTKVKGNTPIGGQKYSKFVTISEVSAPIYSKGKYTRKVSFWLIQYCLYNIVFVLKSSAWLLIWSVEWEVFYAVNFPPC